MEAVEIIPRVFPDLSFIHVADFIHQLRTSRKRIVVLKLASILALAARISPSLLADPKRSRCLSQQLSAYTQQNLWPGLVQEPDTDTMHCLLLTAQYEWGDGNGFAAWMYSGRPSSLDRASLKINLPCTDDEFDLGVPAANPLTYSQLLSTNAESLGRKFTIADHSAVIVRSGDIWFRACKWVAEGGRRKSSVVNSCPWETDSEWHQIKTEIFEWRRMLDSSIKYPQTPVAVYVRRRQAESFAFINLIHYLSILMIYREYLPFVPKDRNEVICGPIQPPLLLRQAPQGWWQEYYDILFDSSTRITQIITELEDAHISLLTPHTGYCVFSAASMNVYRSAFPWADPGNARRPDATELKRRDLDF
ncbi:unnamed protein product [Parascedosporium putredinis]|uniref:Uncharacterized protein n=1 Tax=Parascedosporium putredinis TaxID=1442378 RepID=A0A9P1H1N5_9PEZI|nr:unnamed protein product [Parascedosporium putredinis]CAI7993791.1 unnamed protein product [Parascedosporium putredinis]